MPQRERGKKGRTKGNRREKTKEGKEEDGGGEERMEEGKKERKFYWEGFNRQLVGLGLFCRAKTVFRK